MTSLDDFLPALRALRLDPNAINQQGELLRRATLDNAKPLFSISDTCRFENSGLLPMFDPVDAAVATNGAESTLEEPGHGFAAFIPAAGAASRYSQPLFALVAILTEIVESGGNAPEKMPLARDCLTALAAGAKTQATWPLPASIRTLLAEPLRLNAMTLTELQGVIADLQLPKALMPCVKEGISFLAMKHQEHRHLAGLMGEVYVTPPGQQAAFAAALQAATDAGSPPLPGFASHFLEQGPALSTIRWHRDGRPFVEPDGMLSPVPAGHGALAQLFPEVRRLIPGAGSVFIRNIDNIMGTGAAATAATARFLRAHKFILGCVQAIRQALAKGDDNAAASAADRLLALTTASSYAAAAELRPCGVAEAKLVAVQLQLFHAHIAPAAPLRQELQKLFNRPVTMLGQVPNTGKDVGGTPCFIRGDCGESPGAMAKVCIEVPHVSVADKDKFLADPGKATHFNPVFCAVEINANPHYYSAANHSYWLMSEKVYRGVPVIYYETILYELIGNSTLTNCVFIEVPRLVFNPHKTLLDALGRSAADWLG